MRKLLALLFVGVFALVGMFASLTYTPAPTYAQETSTQSNSVTVETVPGQSLKQIIETRTEKSWPWYVVRASGIVAGISLVILLLSGIGSVTGHSFRFLDPLTTWATHRALGITFVVAILIHMLTLLVDHFIPFSLIDILVPWASDYKTTTVLGVHVGSLFVALGVLAFYGSIIVVATSLLLVDRKPKLWKLVHYLSYLIIFDVFIHALFLGTDTGHGIGRTLWILGNIAVFAAIIVRLRRAGAS